MHLHGFAPLNFQTVDELGYTHDNFERFSDFLHIVGFFFYLGFYRIFRDFWINLNFFGLVGFIGLDGFSGFFRIFLDFCGFLRIFGIFRDFRDCQDFTDYQDFLGFLWIFWDF